MRRILYIGSDGALYDELVDFYNKPFFKKGDYETKYCKIIPEEMISCHDIIKSYIYTGLPHLILVDFVKLQETPDWLEHFLFMIYSLKKCSLLSATPLIGLFKDKEQQKELEAILCQGFCYFYVKSDDNTVLFTDSFYMAFEGKVRFPEYALASKIDLPYNLTGIAFLGRMNLKKVLIEMDLKTLQGQRLNIGWEQFNQFGKREVSVEVPYDYSLRSFSTDSFLAEIPFPGPWDDIDEDSLLPDMVEGWVQNSITDIRKDFVKIFVIDARESSFLNYIDKYDENYRYFSNVTDAMRLLPIYKPDIIAYEVEELVEEDNSILRVSESPNEVEKIYDIHSIIQQCDNYSPSIVIFNNRSTSEAFSSAIRYEKILVNSNHLTFDFLDKLKEIVEHVNNINNINNINDDEGVWDLERDDFFVFPLTASKSVMNYEIAVMITSLTEHELTFVCNQDLPYYSIFKSKVPVEHFLTIIPPTRELKADSLGKHYQALIHGVTDNELQIMRVFVNSIIKKPLREWATIESNIDVNAQDLEIDIDDREIYVDETSKDKDDQNTKVKRQINARIRSKL